LSAGRLRVQVPSGPPISGLTAIPITKVDEIALSTPTFQFDRSEFPVRSVGATRSVWARETAGASPAALTDFKLLPWPNTSGIRLLSGLHAGGNPAGSAKSLLPGGVKVAWRPVKPFGVGASPTLAANSQGNVSSRRPCSERGGCLRTATKAQLLPP
jgi:hypothetical protein